MAIFSLTEFNKSRVNVINGMVEAGRETEFIELLGRLVVVSCMSTDLGGNVRFYNPQSDTPNRPESALFLPYHRETLHPVEDDGSLAYVMHFYHIPDSDARPTISRNFFVPVIPKSFRRFL